MAKPITKRKKKLLNDAFPFKKEHFVMRRAGPFTVKEAGNSTKIYLSVDDKDIRYSDDTVLMAGKRKTKGFLRQGKQEERVINCKVECI